MLLPVPVPGVDPGPDYANNINSSLNIIDSHTHAPGSGVQVTPLGLNINTNLSFQNNQATNVYGVLFSSPASSSQTTFLYTAAQSGGGIYDLYYNDGAGNVIPITKAGIVNAIASSIPGESYSAGTFTWKQGAGSTTPANFDIGSVTIRPNTAATTNGITLSPPSAISSAYSLLLPALPSVQSFMTLDNSGNITAPWVVDNATIIISSNTIQVGSISTANIADGSITDAKIAAGTITADKFSSTVLGKSIGANVQSYTSAGSNTWTVPSPTGESTIFVIVEAVGGGAGGSGNGAGGVGGDTTFNGVTICQGAGKLIPYGFYSGGAAGNHAGQASQNYSGGSSGGSGGGGGASSLGAGGTGGTTNGAGGNGSGNGSGGGGGGAGGIGGAGGAGCNIQTRYFNLTAGASITVVVGAGGTGAGAGGGFATAGNGADGAINIYY